MKSGTLYIVGTPIGNLRDITQRGVEILQGVDRIYAEDTRVSQKLLQRYEIQKPLFSYREAASRVLVEKTISELIFHLKSGQSVAYITDAGTPGLSDPGSFLVRKVWEAGIEICPIPGPSAMTGLLSVSGMAISRPLFVGFLPKKKGHQTLMKKLREGLVEETADALVFYESPERISKLLQELLVWNIPLLACLGRELTKVHEEIIRGDIKSLCDIIGSRQSIKGEITLIVSRIKI